MRRTVTTQHSRIMRKGRLRRLGMWLGMLVLLLQVLIPLSQSHAAQLEDGLFPAACASHGGDESPSGSEHPAVQHCPFCQIHLGDSLIPPMRVAFVAFDRIVQPELPLEMAVSAPLGAAAVPPLPSRGPPSAA